MAYTKGPWDWDGGDPPRLIGRLGVKIFDADSYEGMWLATYDEKEDTANKSLIAAAPDMYEALKEQQAIITGLQEFIAAYLPGETGKSAHGAMSEVIGRLDGPEQRRALNSYNKAISKAEGE